MDDAYVRIFFSLLNQIDLGMINKSSKMMNSINLDIGHYLLFRFFPSISINQIKNQWLNFPVWLWSALNQCGDSSMYIFFLFIHQLTSLTFCTCSDANYRWIYCEAMNIIKKTNTEILQSFIVVIYTSFDDDNNDHLSFTWYIDCVQICSNVLFFSLFNQF